MCGNSMRWTVVSLLLLLASGSDGSIRCLECTDMFKPFFCDTVTVCADSEECFLDKFVTSAGQLLYNSGCRSKQRCESQRKRSALGSSDVIGDVIPADSTTDIEVCQQCCNDTNFCNIQGCDEALLPRDQRGPYCFECSNQNEHGCRHLTSCDLNYACEIKRKVKSGYTVYDSACVHIEQASICNATHGSTYSAIIGKRASADGCPKCCDEDFCNEACSVSTPTVPTPDGGFSNWNSWNTCTATCGGYGTQFRSRTCVHPPCTGTLVDHRSCNSNIQCPALVDGEWGSWAPWQSCSTTCSFGIMSRTRDCNNPPPQNGGQYCVGEHIDTTVCSSSTPCSTTDEYTPWGTWGGCSVTCGSHGIETRSRSCKTSHCSGSPSSLSESRSCQNTSSCADEYTPWGTWGGCSVTCGSHGIETRSRSCKTSHCSGSPSSLSESRPCQHTSSCTAVDGGWSQWHNWGHCSVTCGTGQRMRTRSCSHPAPGPGGADCAGSSQQHKACHVNCHTAQQCREQPGYNLYPFHVSVGTDHDTVHTICMKFYNHNPTDWFSARLQCQQDKADLVTFSSDVSYLDHVFPTLGQNVHNIWIGLEYVEGQWAWVDNTYGLGNHASGRLGRYYVNHIQHIAGGNTNQRACVTDLSQGQTGTSHGQGQGWVPVDCSQKHFFVCERHF